MRYTSIIVTFFGIGKCPISPGTLASAFALLLSPLITINNQISIILISFLLIIGTIMSNIYAKNTNTSDPKEVVIDEVAGQLVTIYLYLYMCNRFDITEHFNITTVVLCFILFRIFDIIKPLPIYLCDKYITGGIGIMLDDVVAAAIAAIISVFITAN